MKNISLGVGKVLVTTVLATAVGGFVGLNQVDAAQGGVPKVLQEKIKQGAIDWGYNYTGDNYTYKYNLGKGYVYGSGKYSLEGKESVALVSKQKPKTPVKAQVSVSNVQRKQVVQVKVSNVQRKQVPQVVPKVVDIPKASEKVRTVQQSRTNVVTYKAPAKQQAVVRGVPSTVKSDVGAIALGVAKGKRYKYGENSAYSVDCSAFAQQVMSKMGKTIPRTTYGQMSAGKRVSNPQPGDLVFFNGGSHVGVYIGNGQMVDALNQSEGVGQRAVSYVSGKVDGYYRY